MEKKIRQKVDFVKHNLTLIKLLGIQKKKFFYMNLLVIPKKSTVSTLKLVYEKQ